MTINSNSYESVFSEYNDVVSVDDIMQMLKIGKNAVYNLLKSNEIKCFRIGKCYKVPKTSVIAYINSQI